VGAVGAAEGFRRGKEPAAYVADDVVRTGLPIFSKSAQRELKKRNVEALGMSPKRRSRR